MILNGHGEHLPIKCECCLLRLPATDTFFGVKKYWFTMIFFIGSWTIFTKCVVLKSCRQTHVTCHVVLFIEMYHIQLV